MTKFDFFTVSLFLGLFVLTENLSYSFCSNTASDVDLIKSKRNIAVPSSEQNPEVEDHKGETLTNSPNIIIFDWDDTLFPTTLFQALKNTVYSETSNENVRLLLLKGIILGEIGLLDPLVVQALQTALDHGTVFIVTNASPGWIKHCLNSMYPKVKNLIHDKKINIIYSKPRDIPSHQKSTSPSPNWKISTFKQILDQHLDQEKIFYHTISIGDDPKDREAIFLAAQQYKNRKLFIKSIKLKTYLDAEIKHILTGGEIPKTIQTMKDQLRLIINNLNELFSKEEQIDSIFDETTKKFIDHPPCPLPDLKLVSPPSTTLSLDPSPVEIGLINPHASIPPAEGDTLKTPNFSPGLESMGPSPYPGS